MELAPRILSQNGQAIKRILKGLLHEMSEVKWVIVAAWGQHISNRRSKIPLVRLLFVRSNVTYKVRRTSLLVRRPAKPPCSSVNHNRLKAVYPRMQEVMTSRNADLGLSSFGNGWVGVGLLTVSKDPVNTECLLLTPGRLTCSIRCNPCSVLSAHSFIRFQWCFADRDNQQLHKTKLSFQTSYLYLAHLKSR